MNIKTKLSLLAALVFALPIALLWVLAVCVWHAIDWTLRTIKTPYKPNGSV